MPKNESDWIDKLLDKIKQRIEQRSYRLSDHVIKRQSQRSFELPDLIHVLMNGFHEECKTLFSNKFQCWNYAIRGKTLDGTEARVIVAFEKNMIIITAIRLTRKK